MRRKQLLLRAGYCAAFALALQAQSGSDPAGFSVTGWSAVAPAYPIVAVRDVAATPEGFYVVAEVSSTYGRIGALSGANADIYVARFDPAGALAWSKTIAGAGPDSARAIALDQAGYVYVAGSTRSADFPRSNSLEAAVPDGSQAAFLWKIDPATGAVVYSTLFGAAAPTDGAAPRESEVLDVAVDAAGAAYVTGWTNSPFFPVSVDAFDSNWTGQTGFGPARTAFVAKFAPDGALLYATYLGGEERICSGGSNCIPVVPYTDGIRIALGPAGALFVAGVTNTTDFPVTAGAVQNECRCNRGVGDVFVARFAPDGRTLEYGTYLGGNPYGDSTFPSGAESLTDLAVDSSGAYIAGWTSAPDFPTTAAAVQPEFHREVEFPTFGSVGVDGFVAKLSPDGSALEYSTFLGGLGEDRIVALALQPDGSLVLSGVTAASDFPLTPGFLDRGNAFLATLSADGAAVDFSTRLATGIDDWPPPEGRAVFSPDQQRLALAGGRGIVTYFERSGPDHAAVWFVAGAADSEPSSHISPGEVISLYGVRIGPDQPVSFDLDENSRVPLELAGVRVLFDGAPAPVLYAQHDQINVVAPFGLESEGETTIQLLRDGAAIGPVVTATRPASPGILRSGPALAIVNADDGTVNSPESPASRGSIVAIWATGAGSMSPRPVDGDVATTPLSSIEHPVRVVLGFDETQAEVLYAGAAPGIVQGVVQINFRIPPNQTPIGEAIPLLVEINGVRSPAASVHVH